MGKGSQQGRMHWSSISSLELNREATVSLPHKWLLHGRVVVRWDMFHFIMSYVERRELNAAEGCGAHPQKRWHGIVGCILIADSFQIACQTRRKWKDPSWLLWSICAASWLFSQISAMWCKWSPPLSIPLEHNDSWTGIIVTVCQEGSASRTFVFGRWWDEGWGERWEASCLGLWLCGLALWLVCFNLYKYPGALWHVCNKSVE